MRDCGGLALVDSILSLTIMAHEKQQHPILDTAKACALLVTVHFKSTFPSSNLNGTPITAINETVVGISKAEDLSKTFGFSGYQLVKDGIYEKGISLSLILLLCFGNVFFRWSKWLTCMYSRWLY